MQNSERWQNLVHPAHKLIDVSLTVASITAIAELGALIAESATRVGQLEGPEELIDNLELGTNGGELVNDVLHADNSVLAKDIRDNLVVCDGDAVAPDLGKTALVDKLADGLQVGVAIGNVGLNKKKHLLGSSVELNEDGVVDLAQTEQAQDLLDLRVHAVDTTDAHDKRNLGFLLAVEVASSTSLTAELDEAGLTIAVLNRVLLSALENLLAGGLVSLSCVSANSFLQITWLFESQAVCARCGVPNVLTLRCLTSLAARSALKRSRDFLFFRIDSGTGTFAALIGELPYHSKRT
jgi:hypothetical protein